MSIDSSASSGAPAPAAEPISLPDPAEPDQDLSPIAEPGDDGATTPGGPTMILVITGVVTLISWLRRRRRRQALNQPCR
jgi:hypothetical protein